LGSPDVLNVSDLKNFGIRLFIWTFFCPAMLFAQNANTVKPLTANANLQLTNNGIAPVPAFSLGRPAIIGTAILKKGRFYFNPEFLFAWDLKPWTINMRFGVNVIENEKLTMGVAATPSLYFRELPYNGSGGKFELQRYFATEFNFEYRFTSNRRLLGHYWYSWRVGALGLKNEHFILLSFAFDKMKLGKHYQLSLTPSLFYLHDYNYMEGVFASQMTNFQRDNWKLNFFAQMIQPIYLNPKGSFLWNAGINIPL